MPLPLSTPGRVALFTLADPASFEINENKITQEREREVRTNDLRWLDNI